MNLQKNHSRGLLVAVLVTICLLAAACGEQQVATAGDEFEANLMFDILHSNNFRVNKKSPEGDVKTWSIWVDEGWFGEGEAATAIQVLRDYGLPRPPEPELKNNDALGITSDRVEKERQKRELQQQIERQLYTQPDVIRANVIIAQPTDDILSLEKTPPTASVVLVLKEPQPKITVASVQSLVAGDVPNLKAENVTVQLSQQALREIPLEKLEERRRTNAIFAVGIGVVILLALTLGTVLIIAKRRRKKSPASAEQLTEGSETADFETVERPLLGAESSE